MEKKTALGLCVLVLCQACIMPVLSAEPPVIDTTVPASSESPVPSEAPVPEDPPLESYHVTLGDCCIGSGTDISYTTISPENAGRPIPEGYYPGELTVELTGLVVVEEGGSLAIGTLSIDGPECSPVLTGSGQIIVKAGGRLRLTDAVLEASGEHPLIVQEPGASIELQRMQAEAGTITWSSPLGDNHYTAPDDIWLECGTPLTEEMLPETMEVDVQEQGVATWTKLPLVWDFSVYQGQTEGTLTLSGSFLDEDGQPLTSFLPLEVTVHWYIPERLVVSNAVWKGDLLPTVQLTVLNLPSFADIWGEVSTDNGATWTRWEGVDQFFIVDVEGGGNACVFVLPDETPRLFRILAEDPWEHLYWRSDAFALEPEETDDSGGNRGGSTNPLPPERTPEPLEPSPTPTPEATPPVTLSPSPPVQNVTDPPTETALPPAETAAVKEPAASPEPPEQLLSEQAAGKVEKPLVEVKPQETQATNAEVSDPEPEADTSPEPEATADSSNTQPVPETAQPSPPTSAEHLQILPVACGIAVCAALGLAIAILSARHKKK